MGGYVGHVGALAVALGVGSAVALGNGCALAAADPTHSSTSSGSSGSSRSPGPSAKTADPAKPKRQHASKPRKPTAAKPDIEAGDTGSRDSEDPEDVASTPRAAIDKVGAALRTTVRAALGSVASDRPGADDEAATKALTVKAPAKRAATIVERLLPDAATSSHPEADTGVEADEPEPKAPVVVEVGSIATIPKSVLTPAPGPKLPEPKAPAPPKIAKVEDTVTGAVSTVINTVLNPFSVNSTPDSPAEPAAAWAMLAFARREFEHAFRQPQNLLTQVSTLSAVTARGPVALAPGIVVPDSLVDKVNVTEGPSLFDQVTVLALTAFREISEVIGVDITTSLGGGISVPNPPPILTVGLDVRATEFTAQDADGVEQTWQVWEISNPRSDSDEHVIAFHGGGLVTPPNIFHWLDYTQMSRQTGATVIVPRYPLIPDGGTADNTVPPAADLITAYVAEYGAENVSVYGESSGGMVAVLAVQKIIRDCEGDTQCVSSRVPSRMVLSSPGLTDPEVFTDPNVVLVNDPLFGVPESDGLAQWRSQQDPELSDTFLGSVEGLPRTTIYIGTREIIAPGALKFAKAIDDAGGDVSVVIGMGQMHAWATLPINSQYANYRDDIYRQLGIVDDDADEAISL